MRHAHAFVLQTCEPALYAWEYPCSSLTLSPCPSLSQLLAVANFVQFGRTYYDPTPVGVFKDKHCQLYKGYNLAVVPIRVRARRRRELHTESQSVCLNEGASCCNCRCALTLAQDHSAYSIMINVDVTCKFMNTRACPSVLFHCTSPSLFLPLPFSALCVS